MYHIDLSLETRNISNHLARYRAHEEQDKINKLSIIHKQGRKHDSISRVQVGRGSHA